MRRLANMRKAALAFGGMILLTVGSGVVLSGMGSQRFPHERHTNLFPTCLGCHAGIPEGDAATAYSVEPALCSGCHNGSVQPEVDWEIWIQEGIKPLPHKFAITYKKQKGSPRYVATLKNWMIPARHEAATFTFTPPAGAQKIDVMPVTAP